MKISQEQVVSRLITLIRLDAKNLFERIKKREIEYLTIFSLKRTRSHFPAVFRSRYNKVGIADLKFLSPELLVVLDEFYETVDKMEWYLTSTEDMPQTVDDRVHFFIKDLQRKYDLLMLYFDGETEDEMEPLPVEDEEMNMSGEFQLEESEDNFEELSDEVLNDLTSS
ncbi:hypothetical protein [Halobacteriovorax sp. JY17]|uniref:hypothetical protein n=1 Tax=Halobacteriovorax sp. JY17 TaxID=2014617 RepID=UPI000C35C8B8|nr:hypothetical protein [Halobacteriovorax sp. JY17]PIK14633.1 MAG: hypothetical protein CES88_09855 [Halobacteriovorax sp. JY17]